MSDGLTRESYRGAAVRSGPARVFVGPEPERGAHPGYRGLAVADALGVHFDPGVEALSVDNDDPDWPMGEWFETEEPITLPWHRVYVIQWDYDIDA